MRAASLLVLSSLLTACHAQTQQAVVLPERLNVRPAVDGRVTVSGSPGAVQGGAYGVAFTVRREGGLSGLRIQHLSGEGLPIYSGFALVAADGSLAETTLGDAENAVRPGDELNVRPMRRRAEAGFVELSDAGENVAVAIP